MSPAEEEDLRNRFAFHPATTTERQTDHETVRQLCLDLALAFGRRLPPGREKSLVMTHLEEVMFWANAAIARQPEPVEPDSGTMSGAFTPAGS